jgi:hypothetical protein
MLYLAMWRNGQYDEAIAGWQDYEKRFPASTQAKRFIPINMAYLAEAKSDQAADCAKAARLAAEDFKQQAAKAEAAGDSAGAAAWRTKAEDADRTAQEMTKFSDDEWAKAKQIYTDIASSTPNKQDSVAQCRLLRRTGLENARQGRYAEAVSYLELARYAYLDAFDEISDLMIDLKLEGGLPLSISEQLSLERRREAAAYAPPDAPKPKRFVECAYSLPAAAPHAPAAEAPGVAPAAADPASN